MGLHIFRVHVRGRFDDLDEPVRARLLAEADDHSPARAGFSEAGTLTYDRTLTSFGFRIQVRERADDPGDAEARAIERGEAEARATLGRLGAGSRDLRTTAGDMAAVWQRPGGGRPRSRSAAPTGP